MRFTQRRDGDNMFLRNVGKCNHHAVQKPKVPTIYQPRENLKT